MSRERLLIPNLGAEEGDDWRAHRREPAVRCAARLWRGLFGPGARWLEPDADDAEAPWPPELGAAPAEPVFAWLDAGGDATAWLNTDEAARSAAAAGRKLCGPPAAVVRRVHDKAFAQRAALAADLVPASLREAVRIFEPAELGDAAAAVRAIEAALAAWPAPLRARFTLKPRFGSSGRGRVAGADGRADTPALRGALPRLAARGGALLEPWLARRADLSAQLCVEADGGLRLLGTSEQVVTPSGLPLGHRGVVDARGRVASGTRHDEPVREAAAAIGAAAAREGFFGPCGLDVFAFDDPLAGPDDPREPLRVAELNARFTTGLVALGWVRRALRTLERRSGLAPGELRAFYFGVDAPAGGWPEAGDGDAHVLVPIGWRDDGPRPALLVAETPEALDALLAPRASRERIRPPSA